MLLVLSAVIGILGYGTARQGGAPVAAAVDRGTLAFFSAMTLGLALIGILLTAL
ncbi:hypothetical protein KNE206_54120 [Kitasatospora sp. NE20-6]